MGLALLLKRFLYKTYKLFIFISSIRQLQFNLTSQVSNLQATKVPWLPDALHLYEHY